MLSLKSLIVIISLVLTYSSTHAAELKLNLTITNKGLPNLNFGGSYKDTWENYRNPANAISATVIVNQITVAPLPVDSAAAAPTHVATLHFASPLTILVIDSLFDREVKFHDISLAVSPGGLEMLRILTGESPNNGYVKTYDLALETLISEVQAGNLFDLVRMSARLPDVGYFPAKEGKMRIRYADLASRLPLSTPLSGLVHGVEAYDVETRRYSSYGTWNVTTQEFDYETYNLNRSTEVHQIIDANRQVKNARIGFYPTIAHAADGNIYLIKPQFEPMPEIQPLPRCLSIFN